MASKAPTYRSAALSGLVLAVTVAQESTNNVPIVNQVLGAVSRIAKLAAKIEKDRETLRALANKVDKLARRITAVLSDRAPEGELLASLEGVYSVLLAVQHFFEAHIARSPIRRAMSYLLSVPRDVERLTADLEDALQEFLLVSALDTNIRVQENSRFIGQFRRVRDFEIEKLELISRTTSDDGSASFRYHAARVEGTERLFVVRSLAGAESDRTAESAVELRQRVKVHDGILEEISTVSRSHPNIAYLYGKSAGVHHNRFIVLRTGPRFLVDIVPELTLTSTWSMIEKLLDAARHLTQFGAVWLPDTHRLCETVFIDDRGEPTIGVIHDLQSAQAESSRTVYESQLVVLSEIFSWVHRRISPRGDAAWSDITGESEWPYPQLRHAIAAACEVDLTYRTLRRSELASLGPLDRETQAYLRTYESVLDNTRPRAESLYWSQTLFGLATGNTSWVGSGLYAAYHATPAIDSDVIFLHRVADDGDQVQHACYRLGIPPDQTANVRQALGIITPDAQSQTTTFELVYVDGSTERSITNCQWVRR